MEMNTVNISTERYNDLRDFKEKVMNGEAASSRYGGGYYFYEKGEIIKELEERIEGLKKSQEHLTDPEYNKGFVKAEDLRTWSIFKFISFRRKAKRDFKQRLIKCAENSSN